MVDELEGEHRGDAEEDNEAQQDEGTPPAEAEVVAKVVAQVVRCSRACVEVGGAAAGVVCTQELTSLLTHRAMHTYT